METTKAKRALSKKESQKERNRIRVAIKRANMNETEREKQKEEQRNTAMFRRLIELPEERERRRERERVRAIERRSSEGSLKREERLRVGRERAVKRRWAESVTEREERLRVNRERVALKRRLKRLGLEGCGLEGYQWQRDSDKCDWSNGIELAGISVEAIVNVLESFPQEQRLGILNLIQSDFSNKTGRNPKADQRWYSSCYIADHAHILAPPLPLSPLPMSSLLVDLELFEERFNEYCLKSFVTDIHDHTSDDHTHHDHTPCDYINKDLSQRIVCALRDPLKATPFREWIKGRGFHLGCNSSLHVPMRVNEGAETVTKWKKAAVVEEFYSIIKDHHVDHCNAETTHHKLLVAYHGVPFEAVQTFISMCPVCATSVPPIRPLDQSVLSSVPGDSPPKEHDKDDSRCFMKKGQIEFLPINNNTQYGVGLYLDTWSNYHVLFTVNSTGKSSASFATSLSKRVYPYYGIPRSLVSTMGVEFINEVIQSSRDSWPDAAAIHNGCKKNHNGALIKRASKSKLLISQLLQVCNRELHGVSLPATAMEDLLLSIQYKMNILMNKKSHQCPYQLVYNQLPVSGPHTQQLLCHLDATNEPSHSDTDDDDEGAGLGDGANDMNINSACIKNAKVPDIMNKLAPKVSSSTTSSQKLQQMLAAGTIHAQEQQVTSLRELLRQEEKRLEMLKQIRSSPAPIKATPTPSMGTVHMTGIDSTHGVIRSTHGLLPSASNTAISSRLQQLVDSVAVTQMSSQATQLKNSLKQQQQAAGKSNNSRANTTSVPQNGIQKTITELDEATIARTIESSTRYREFLIRQSNLKRNFQKQIDKRIGSAPYPKTFRQVWPIIPVQDPHFVKNIGLECVTLYFDPSYRRPPAPPSKIKPTCNQCGCDYASAWQIRKNNSKQVLLCEACDFTNLKLFQRTKLATQLKELMDSVHKEEDRFKQEYEENRKKTVAVERAALLSNIQQQQSVGSKYLSSVPEPATTKRSGPVITNGSPHILVPASQVTPTSTISKKTSVAGGNEDSKRKRRTIEEHGVSKIAKITTGNLDLTLDKISQQLIRKQVDEKVVGRRQKASGINTCVISSVTKGPPPLKQATPISNATPTQSLKYPVVTLPPPLINNSPANSDSRKNRRKGKPRHKLMSNE